MVDQVLVQLLVGADHLRHFEVFSGSPGRSRPYRLSGFLVTQEKGHSAGKALCVPRWHKETFSTTCNEVRHSADRCAYNRQTGGHRLHHRERVTLPIRAQNKYIHCTQHVWNISTQSKKVNLSVQSKVPRLFFQLFLQKSLSYQDQLRSRIEGGALGESLQE